MVIVGAVPTTQSRSQLSVPIMKVPIGGKPVPLSVMFLSKVNVTTMSSSMA